MNGQNREEAPKKKGPGKGAWAAGMGLLLLLGKLKPVMLFVLKAGKPLITMFLSIGAYALFFPWTFAVGFVFLLLVHELGHVWAARRSGLPVSAPMFIPFLGALITMKRHPKDAATEAYIGIGGPIWGTAGALACYAIGWWSGHPIWFALAYTGFFLNLINLLPIHPLDGGRIVVAVSRWLWLIGAVAGPVLIWQFGSVLFFVIWLLFLWEMYKRFFRDKNKGEPYAMQGEYTAQADPALPDWYFAGQAHARELPYTAYCEMDGEHVVRFHWEPLSFTGELRLNSPCVIDRVLLEQVKGPDQDRRISFVVRMEGRRFEPVNYYDVPMRTRIRMGFMYGGLVLVLFLLMWQIDAAGLVQPVD
jgi:Zn-dependent protease